MAITVKIMGMKTVLRNLNKEIEKIKHVSAGRLYEAGLLVKNRSVKKTPVKTGNLRGSAYVTLEKGMGSFENKASVEIGYTASYAAYVHEMPEHFSFSKAGTGPKFLERALLESQKDILRILNKKMV